MRDLRPFIVTAPLTIVQADKLDTDTIYVFDYENSFKNEENKADKMITYLESFGGMFDIFLQVGVSYGEREELFLRYFHSGSFFNVYTLTQTMVHLMYVQKEIPYFGDKSIFTDDECKTFIERNKTFINEVVQLYDSLFLIMLIYSSKPTKEIKDIKSKYSEDGIISTELSPNLLSVLLDGTFYKYYEKHISDDMYYYSFLFDNRLYKSMTFLDVLTNSNNNLLPVMIDLNNKKFQEFVMKNIEKH